MTIVIIFSIFNGIIYTTTITVCNKETISSGFSTIVSTDQQTYSINNDPIIDMKASIGKTINAHVYTMYGCGHPVIYGIDGPVPCGNTTCGV
jgi:hypothetical protein